MNFLKILVLGLAAAVLGGCGKKDVKLITFNVASMRGVETGLAYKNITMPFTGTRLIMNTDTVLYSGDISDIYVAENPMPSGDKITGFYFVFNSNGTRKLTNITASNMGSYIVLSYAGEPIGLRIIDTIITDGRLFVCSEFSDPKRTIHKLVDEMRQSVSDVSEIKRDNM